MYKARVNKRNKHKISMWRPNKWAMHGNWVLIFPLVKGCLYVEDMIHT